MVFAGGRTGVRPGFDEYWGTLYPWRRCLPQDYGKAIDFFRKAAEGGDAIALYNLGWAYEQGLGVPANRQQAIEWYSKAAGKGDVLSIKRLDSLSEQGGLWSSIRKMVGL